MTRGERTRSSWLSDFVQDVRRAARSLLRSPGYTLPGLLTIALGIGATTAVFSLGNAMLFRPLPVPAASRVMGIYEHRSGNVNQGPEGVRVPFARYEKYRDALRSTFTDLAAHQYNTVSLSFRGAARSVPVALVTRNYFDVLQLHAQMGSMFSARRDPVIVIGDRLWHSLFNADPNIVGASVLIDGAPFTVAGVAPASFAGTSVPFLQESWVPIDAYAGGGEKHNVGMFGRLADGVAAARAQVAVNTAATTIPPDEKQTRVSSAKIRVVTGLGENLRADVSKFVSMLLVTSFLVLLISAANLAGMQLTRAAGRRREIAVQAAIGAGRGRIARYLLTESVLLFVVGGAAGVVLAYAGTHMLSGIDIPISAPTVLDVRPDLRVLAIALALAGVTGTLFGLFPAVAASDPDLVSSLKDGARAGTRSTRGRSTFVVAQVAIAVLLLVVSGLFVRSLRKALVADVGFDPGHVVVGTINLGPHGYDQDSTRWFVARLEDRLRASRDVQAVAVSRLPLLSGSNMFTDVGNAENPSIAEVNAGLNGIDTAFLGLMKMKLVAGRNFNRGDAAGSQDVTIINETLARRLWPSGSPIGHELKRGDSKPVVIGVVRDARYNSATEDDMPYAFFPIDQDYPGAVAIHVRSTAPEGEVLDRLRREVNAIDPTIALDAGRSMKDYVTATLFAQKFAAGVVGLFGVVGMILAALGVYGVLSYQVAQRTREFGIRVAIGAAETDVLGQVLRYGLRLAIIGSIIGLFFAALVTRLVRAFLFGIRPLDLVTFLSVPIILTLVAMVASYVPARRATKVPPTVALRTE